MTLLIELILLDDAYFVGPEGQVCKQQPYNASATTLTTIPPILVVFYTQSQPSRVTQLKFPQTQGISGQHLYRDLGR